METKDDLILAALHQLLQVSTKLARSEELPIPVEDGLVVSTREAHTIEAVGQAGRLTVTEAARTFGVSKSAASQMLSKLCDKGYLDKAASPHNNKELPHTLTALGRKAFEAHEQLHGKDRQALLERLQAFSIEQVATITVLLEAIGDVLDQRLA